MDSIPPGLLASLVHASPDVLYLYRLKTDEYQFVSRAAPLPRPGQNRPEGAAIHPEDRPQIEAHFRRVEAGQDRVSEVEYRMQGTGGDVWYLLREFVFERDNQGRVISIGGILKEITERKKSEAATEDSERLLRAVLDATPDPVFLKDISSRIILANPATIRVAQKPPEGVIGKKDDEIFSDDNTAGALMENDRRVIETGETMIVEERIPGPDGERMFLTTKSPFRDRSGSITGVLGVAHDITERIRMEEELRQSEARLAEAQAVARIGSWTTDLSTFQVNWSDETFRIFAVDQDTFSPSHEAFLGFVHPEDRASVDAAFRDSFSRDAYNAVEHRIIAADGTIKYIEERWRIYRDAQGIPRRAVGTCQDISERRLAQEALGRAEKLESVGVLAAGIAHDFNNLMGGLFGYMDLARETLQDPERARSYLDRAMDALERARSLTRQLLTFARGNAPEKTTASIVPVLVNNTRFVLSGSNVAPAFHLDDNLWLCDFDTGQMGQVIDNLVINAMQAMPRGGTVTLSARNVLAGPDHALKPGRYVQISVADQGPGIPDSIRGRIFDPFFTTKASGNGLGLATAYSIIKKHDGILEVESSAHGSVFHIYLPASTRESSAASAAAVPAHAGAGTILVMDDEPYIRDIAASMLESMGYTAELCENGDEALEKISANPHLCAAILDLTIPGGKGGLETVRKLRSRGIALPVFVSSGYSDDPVMADPQASGFTAGLAKPFRKAELEAMLSRHLPAVK